MAHDFRSARDDAEARLDAAIEPFKRDLAKKAGVKLPTSPREKAERRLSEPEDKSTPIIRKLTGLSADELRRVQSEVNDLLRENER